MKLTIGMPTYYDYSGVVFTVKCLIDRLEKEWPDYKNEVEILVMDNTGGKKYREDLEKELKSFAKPIRYLTYTAERGPAEVKNRVIQHAKGEYTLCIDCHIILREGALGKLRKFLSELDDKQSLDFYTGPLESNSGGMYTSFEPLWRNQMWGIWSSDQNVLKQNEPSPIWGMGCGLFLIRTLDWLGFNKHFKGFGAEEGYIHEKYRKFGREVKCIPWLVWWHRFGNPDAKQTSLSIFGKVRNYVLGFQEIGLDVKPIYDHFVSLEHPHDPDIRQHMVREHGATDESLKTLADDQIHTMHRYHHKISEHNWKRLLQDPISYDTPADDHLEYAYEQLFQDNDNKLREFMPVIRKYAEGCKSVADVSRDACTGVCLSLDMPSKIWNCLYATQPHSAMQKQAMVFSDFEVAAAMLAGSKEFGTEVLYLRFPEPKQAKNVSETLLLLSRKVSKYILLADSSTKANMQAMKELCGTGDWHPIEHHMKFTGFTVLSREKPEKPVRAWPPGYGPGTELKKLLGKIGIVATENCSCNARAVTMDWHGIEWCEKNVELISSWLKEEANRRKLPYLDFAGRLIINKAIKRAKKYETNLAQ